MYLKSSFFSVVVIVSRPESLIFPVRFFEQIYLSLNIDFTSKQCNLCLKIITPTGKIGHER